MRPPICSGRYTARMLKKALALLALVALVVAGLYQFAGLRIALDGTGRRPRFLRRAPDYDALEADRARQRERLPPVSQAGVSQSPAVPGANVANAATDAGRAESVGIPSAQPPVSGAGGSARSPGYWPDFRGPNRDGRYTDTAIRTDWPRDGLPRLWKQPAGLGYASFVTADGRAFTIEQRRKQEVVAAYEIETGREIWTHGWDAAFVETMGGDGPRATPTYHNGQIYALGALGELQCLDATTGVLVWRRNILTDNRAQNLTWGMAAAPLIVDEKVVVLPGGPGGRSVAAYNKTTGEPVWRALDDTAAYVSPVLVTLGGVRQLLIVTATRAVGLTVEDGRLLWEYPFGTDMGLNIAQPLLLGNDRVFLSAGYGKGAAVFEVTHAGDRFTTRRIWENTRMKNKFTSSVLHRGYIYGLDEAILACLDATTGELKWKGGRYGYGQILLAGDHLIVLTEDGDVVLVQASPERHVEVAKFPAIDGKTWNHPVIAAGRLLVRNLQEMAAFDIRPPAR
jgi:outer membrane protein assembly factor BamB